MDEHPGGDEVILAEGGQDATEAFEDVGHSDEARALLPGMLVGEFEKGSVRRFYLSLSLSGTHPPTPVTEAQVWCRCCSRKPSSRSRRIWLKVRSFLLSSAVPSLTTIALSV
jgi:cytochrome b involved in lipid metabolism